MEGQKGGSFRAWNFGGTHSFTVTIQVDNRDIFAEISLTDITVRDEEWHLSSAYITQIVSDSGVEDFDYLAFKKVIVRRNVTSITFAIHVYQSLTGARWMINYWS